MITTDEEKFSSVVELKTSFMWEHYPNYSLSFVKLLFAAVQRTELRKPGFLYCLRENPDSRAVVDFHIFADAILRVLPLDPPFLLQSLVKCSRSQVSLQSFLWRKMETGVCLGVDLELIF